MLTRSQVAKRLGRSIATVRRLEGSALHPIQDRDGVHRFSAREVDAVKHGRSSLPAVQWPPATDDSCDDDPPFEPKRSPQVARLDEARRVETDLREQLAAAKARIVELTQRVAALGDAMPARDDALSEAFFDWLDSRSKGQMRQLALGGMEEFLDLVAELHRNSR